jgi:hypothetical protein
MTDKKKESKLQKQAMSLRDRAMKLQVKDSETFTRAKKGLMILKELEAEIKGTFDPVVDTTNKAHKAALAARKKHLDPVLEAKKYLSSQAGTYVAEQTRLREEAERKIREAQEAEERRLQDLADAQLKAAQEAEAAGEPEKAAEILAEDDDTQELPADMAPVPLPPPPPVTTGLRTTITWKFRIINERLIPREYLIPDQQKIGAYGREHKKDAAIPGVEFYSETKTG